MRFILLALLILSCKPKLDYQPQKQAFFNEANARGCLVHTVDIYFAHLDGTTAGYCVPKFGILLSIDRWQEMGELQKKELVFHEHAHCVFGAEHQDFGLMSPSMHSEEELELMWPKYVELLFKDCLTVEQVLDAATSKPSSN
jgi:hypothetical protein